MFTRNNLLAALARASMTQEALAIVLGIILPPFIERRRD